MKEIRGITYIKCTFKIRLRITIDTRKKKTRFFVKILISKKLHKTRDYRKN